MPEDKESGYGIILDEAIRAISDQQSALDVLTTRASYVASAAALVASLSGREFLGSPRPGIWLKVGLAAYLAVAAVTAYILWPRRKWRFHFSPARLQWLYLESPSPLSISVIKRDLALHLDAYLEHNARKIDRLSWALAGSIGLLLLGTASLVYHLWR
jgi:hypothetical protein